MRVVYERTREAIRERVVRYSQGRYASPFLFFFSYAETLFSPVPVEMALVPLVLARVRAWWYYALLATLGSTLGGITGYIIGYFFYDAFGVWIVETYSLAEEALVIRQALAEHVFSATLIAAFTPFPDKVYMPIAGLLHAPFFVFISALTLGRTARSFLVAYITHRYGARAVELVERYIKELLLVLLIGALLLGAVVFFF